MANMSRNSSAHHDEVFTRVYRYLLRPDLYFAAYKRLQANNGADTRGVNDDTADGFSERKINCIIEALKNGAYEPLPVRRTYIRKKNSPAKKRPLGLPTFTDKLVQDVMRMVLEAIYEPVFSDLSHGFRPNRSCHTALREVKYAFCGVRWFIEGDIRGCFDNIDHNVLISLLSKKVKDARFLQLIRKFLKAGYLENWVYHSTYSGTPQGGILSPILANIYLHELDMFVEKLKKDFYKSPEAQYTREYNRIRARVGKLSKKIASAEGSEKIALVAQWKEERQKLLHTPSRSQTDKEIRYVRYADDFIIGVRGTKEDCAQIKEALKAFIGNALKMELSDEKTLITHSSEAARFLGYDIRIRRNETTKNVGGLPRRALNNQTELLIPLQDKIMNFLFSHGVIMQHENGTIEPVKRAQLVCLTPLEIVETCLHGHERQRDVVHQAIHGIAVQHIVRAELIPEQQAEPADHHVHRVGDADLLLLRNLFSLNGGVGQRYDFGIHFRRRLHLSQRAPGDEIHRVFLILEGTGNHDRNLLYNMKGSPRSAMPRGKWETGKGRSAARRKDRFVHALQESRTFRRGKVE